MVIGIDFDGTWTADPGLWREFCASAQARGHTCVIVTYRRAHAGRDEEFAAAAPGIPVVFVSDMQDRATWPEYLWKPEAARRAGYEVTMWIDDNPSSISPGAVLLGETAGVEVTP